MRRILSAGSAILMLGAGAQAAAQTPPPADPLTVAIHTEDVDRFAALLARTHGAPTATQIQQAYLDPGSYGVHVFTPYRIENAQALADRISENPQAYRQAVERCLPTVNQANGELRAIYLALHGLFPDRPLPQIFVVIGSGNSGGTAGPAAQVLGIEVLCALSPEPDALRQTLRMFFAHETVHTWQPDDDAAQTDPLLHAVLIEGAADYIASVVLGKTPNEAREAWGSAREAELWRQFNDDLAITRNVDGQPPDRAEARTAMHRWVGNYESAPEGWPYEMGYWMGMRIWQRYVDSAVDKHAAMKDVLDWTDARPVLERGGYRP